MEIIPRDKIRRDMVVESGEGGEIKWPDENVSTPQVDLIKVEVLINEN